MSKTVIIDIRYYPIKEMHSKIFDAWDDIGLGDTLEVISNEDLGPLRYDFGLERDGEFEWRMGEKDPGLWIAKLTRIAVPKKSAA